MADLTIKDIARLSNVSISTVSRAMNDDPGINRETKERVLEIVRKFHYIPNNSARNLKMSESNTIALLIKGISNPFFQSMFPIFERELKKQGCDFLLHTVGENQDEGTAAVELAKEKRLKGIVFLGGRMAYPDIILKNITIPFVLCSVAVNPGIPQKSCASVTVDDEKESYKMVDYLCRMGHRKIAIITGRKDDSTVASLRLAGYKKALRDNGLSEDPDLICYMSSKIPEYSEASGYDAAKKLLGSGKEFTAVFVISDRTAIGVYKAIYDAGKKIPSDYSVAGFDGIEMTRYMIPPLTTMVQPAEKMVQSSVRMLMEQINGKEVKEKLIYEASLKIRDSVKEIR